MKNLKVMWNKVLSMVTAGMLLVTPVMGHADSNENEKTNETAIEFTLDDKEIETMSLEEYKKLVKEAYEYLEGKLSKNYDIQSLRSLCYDANIDFVEDDTPFVDANLVYGEEADNGRIQNMIVADELLRDIQDYNQSVIKRLKSILALKRLNFANYDKEVFDEYLKKVIKDSKYNFADAVYDYNTKVEKETPEKSIMIDGEFCQDYSEDLSKYLAEAIKDENYDLSKIIEEYISIAARDVYLSLINPSVFCYDENDKKIMNQIFDDCFYAYFPVATGTSLVDNEDYDKAFKELASLGSEEKFANVNELSTGAEHLCQKILGVGLINTQYDYMSEYYEKERREYYDSDSLNMHKWIPREGMYLNPNCMTELEVLVSQNLQMKHVAVETLNNKIMSKLVEFCNKKTK